MKQSVGASTIELVVGDITGQRVDAIVNAANRSLLGGGGVDGAIHRAAGPELIEACRPLGGCATGRAKITSGFGLDAQYVIHTVGPIWHGGNAGESELLRSCYLSSLELAVEHDLRWVAFPSISTGAYRYPLEQAARIALGTVTEFLAGSAVELEVRFVLFSRSDFETYAVALRELAPEADRA
ncbi:MAG: O-acetyl-ADP-ribose deacetylase [Candidatus Alcyoniella australis]|nr:O-acetyl-ADP-ribose deacetylase [Candidatus Alcyoniella australis]